MTRSRKTKLAIRAAAARTGTRYVRARRAEWGFWKECFSGAGMPDKHQPKMSLVTEYASTSDETAHVPPVKLMAFQYAQQPVDSPERLSDRARDQKMVMMDDSDPRLEPLLIEERRFVREHTVEQYLRVIRMEREIQSMVEGNVALIPGAVTDAHGNQIFGALDFGNFFVLASEDKNNDIFSNPYLIAEPELVDGEWTNLEDVVQWNAVAAREALIGSKIRGIEGLELCTRVGNTFKLRNKWNDDAKTLVVTIICDGIEPSAVCDRLEEVRKALGVQSIGATPSESPDEDIITDLRNPLTCALSKPKELSLFLCNRPVDESNKAASGMGMSRYIASAPVLESVDPS